MRIIKEGNKELAEIKLKRIAEFRCDICGCVWQANRDEYRYSGSPYDGDLYSCHCPCCGEITWGKRI